MRLLHVRESYSDAGSPHDNAVVESFFKYLKRDTYNNEYYDTTEELNFSIKNYVEIYNNLRPHTHLNNLSPNEFEIEYYNNENKPTKKQAYWLYRDKKKTFYIIGQTGLMCIKSLVMSNH